MAITVNLQVTLISLGVILCKEINSKFKPNLKNLF